MDKGECKPSVLYTFYVLPYSLDHLQILLFLEASNQTTWNSCLQKSREPEFQIFPSCGISWIGILGSDLLIYCILKTLWSGKKNKEFLYSKFPCLLSAPKQEWNHVVTILGFADWHALIYQSLGTTLFASYLNSLRSIYIMRWHHSLICLTLYRKLSA